MKDAALRKVRLAVYELVLAMEATGELAHSGAAMNLPRAWPSIGRLAAKRLARARRLCADVKGRADDAEERKAVEAMTSSVEELGKAYEHLEAGPRNKILGRVLSRTVTRVKGQSLMWVVRNA